MGFEDGCKSFLTEKKVESEKLETAIVLDPPV